MNLISVNKVLVLASHGGNASAIAEDSNLNPSLMEIYWHPALPNTSMPNVIRELIHPAGNDWFVAQEYPVVWNGCPGHPGDMSANVLNLFFRQKTLYPGAEIKEAVSFDRSVVGSVLIPRTEADKIPFSSEKLSLILSRFSIVLDSKEAKQLERTLHYCGTLTGKREHKFYATSLESMIDNVIAELGTRDVQVMATTQLGNRAQRGKKVYRVASWVRKLTHEKLVLCHPQLSPQAVFYCHTSPAYKGYVISLEGSDGAKVNALAVCHYDPENFNPIYFERLKVKPSIEPLCHFLPEDHLIWARVSDNL